jgi:hypothetical protein
LRILVLSLSAPVKALYGSIQFARGADLICRTGVVEEVEEDLVGVVFVVGRVGGSWVVEVAGLWGRHVRLVELLENESWEDVCDVCAYHE